MQTILKKHGFIIELKLCTLSRIQILTLRSKLMTVLTQIVNY